MKVPFHDFKKEYGELKKEIDPAIRRVCESGHYILGAEVVNFEKSFAKYLGVGHVVGAGNGMEALQMALMAHDIKEGDEVITTPLSAVATALAIKAVGATPVFVDIDEYHHIDAAKIGEKITARTKAILPVHLYGQSADMATINALAKKHSLAIIEDCAQAHGSTYGGRHVGSFGTGCWSFYPTKNLGTYGDGGAVSTHDSAVSEKLQMIRNYGQKNRYEHPVLGLNSRLDELHAAILLVKLKKLDAGNKQRGKIAGIYRKELRAMPEIRLPRIRTGANHIFHLFVIEAERRDELQNYLRANGISTLVHYPIAIHKQEAFSGFNAINLPVAEKRVGMLLSLPCNPEVSETAVRFVCKKIRSFYGR
ncbi:MAG: DegT/DnrJ/EryC1/StrS family aminotransferase [bacterium]|nr:DegT/DnrJ/EryC1/StrS family aminotransferase [bacterium]